jgi:GTPase involved in cell partitioning and DNA repair
MIETYKTVRKELEQYGHDMVEKKEIILLTKTDVLEPEARAERIAEVKKKLAKQGFLKNIDDSEKDILTVSVYDLEAIKSLSEYLTQHL